MVFSPGVGSDPDHHHCLGRSRRPSPHPGLLPLLLLLLQEKEVSVKTLSLFSPVMSIA